MTIKVSFDKHELQEFCRMKRVRRLALFGSVLRDDFSPSSDIDILVEFEDGQTPSLIHWPEMLERLSDIFGGRRIDLVTLKSLNPRLKADVLAEAEIQYDQAG